MSDLTDRQKEIAQQNLRALLEKLGPLRIELREQVAAGMHGDRHARVQRQRRAIFDKYTQLRRLRARWHYENEKKMREEAA